MSGVDRPTSSRGVTSAGLALVAMTALAISGCGGSTATPAGAPSVPPRTATSPSVAPTSAATSPSSQRTKPASTRTSASPSSRSFDFNQVGKFDDQAAPATLEKESGPAQGCAIKGNVSLKTGERIYHLPGQRYYDKTVIDEGDGERWFCSEKEARAAGWRKSKV